MRNLISPECGVLGNFIGDLTSNSVLSFYIKKSYYSLLFSVYIFGRDAILYKYSFYTQIFQCIASQSNILNKTLNTSFYHT